MKICIFLLIVLLGSVSEVSFVALCATEAKPRNAKKEKKQARLDRKQGETKTSSIGMPAIPEIANAPPVRPDGKLAHGSRSDQNRRPLGGPLRRGLR